MTRFRIVHAPSFDQISHSISDQYFTVDTAEQEMVNSWIRKNPHYLSYAYDGDELIGFVGILPVTMECGRAMEEQEIREEELTADLVLGPESMQYAQYLYITAIAVKDLHQWRSKQCAAALVSCGAGMINNLYDNGYLKKIFANPTTYWGNRIIRKFGLHPLRSTRKSLKPAHDFYGAEATSSLMENMKTLEKRYQRFINDYPWSLE